MTKPTPSKSVAKRQAVQRTGKLPEHDTAAAEPRRLPGDWLPPEGWCAEPVNELLALLSVGQAMAREIKMYSRSKRLRSLGNRWNAAQTARQRVMGLFPEREVPNP